MPNIPGTNVAAPVVPFNTADTFPTHESQYGLGGWREVADLAARDAISQDRQNVGMMVFVVADSSYWQLTTIGTPGTYTQINVGATTNPDMGTF